MGTPQFDRQIFVKQKQSQRPPSRSPLPGALALLVVAALSAFATYRYLKAGGKLPTIINKDTAQVQQLQKKLKAMQARINELEMENHRTRVRRITDKSSSKKAKPDAAKPSDALLAEVAPHPTSGMAGVTQHPADTAASEKQHPAGRVSATPVDKTVSPRAKEPATALQPLLATRQQPSNKELNLLQSNLAASHDEWQATVNRLGNVVGQLDSQRNAIKNNESNVNYLMSMAHRTNVSFTLRKGQRFQRVGPISMKLTDTSVKNQHYNIRLIVDDKAVELKDRALNEVVQFYTSQSQFPLELIVSQIQKGQVSGTLAVPRDLAQKMANTQLQEK